MTSLEPVTSMEHVERLRKDGVLFRSYLDAARRLVPFALPGVLVHVPLATLSLLALTVTAGGSAALVNQRFQLIGTSDAPLLTWTVLLGAVALAGEIVVFPATVVIAAGALVGRHVSLGEALGTTVRRLPSLLVLLLVAATAFGTIWAARAGVLMATGQQWPGNALLVVAAYAAMPGLLAVPGVLMHGCSGLGSIRRAYQLTRLRFLPTALTLAFGVVLVPGAATWALDSGLRQLPGPLATLGWGLAGTVLALAMTPFQAALVAREFLHCMAWRTQVDDSDLAPGLPDGPPPRPVRLGFLPAALLPGVLFSATVLINPFGWPEVAETNVTESWTPEEFSASIHNRGPELRPFDLQALHTGRGQRLIVVMDGFQDHSSLLVCADPSCLKTSFEWAEPRDRDTRWEAGAAGARLPDGRLLLTTWTSNSLELLTCEATTCVRSSGAVATTRSRPESVGVAPAVRQGGGLVVAYADADPAGGDRPSHDLVSFIFCADPSCARPERRQVARLETTVYSATDHNLVVAVGPGDRPVAARYDPGNGQIHVISCLDVACHQPTVTRPVPPSPSSTDDLPWTFGLAMAVRPDGRPVIAYRDLRDQANKLLDCRTPDCAQVDVRTLGAGDEYHAVPALVLDRAGRPLVAFESREHQRLMLAICTGSRCESIPVSKNRGGFGERLAMALNAEGDPTIAWIDHKLAPPGLSWNLHVTTPLNLTPD
ncbi:hypothetical protein [Nonomuraea sp. NPDC049709]|uniref:hypothetical protein n=1 Tax=Nonomuraea sp. NPDC049709 TaxID=3154736 RepID=UPI003414D7A7